MKDIKEANKSNMNIKVGSIVKDKAKDTEENTREGGTRRMSKEVVGCVQDVVKNKNFITKL